MKKTIEIEDVVETGQKLAELYNSNRTCGEFVKESPHDETISMMVWHAIDHVVDQAYERRGDK